MRPLVLVLIIAALAAGLAAFLAKTWLQREADAQTGVGAAVTEVLVVAREVPAGAMLAPEDLRFQRWPTQALTPRLVVRKEGEDVKAPYLGMTVRHTLTEGEPFSPLQTFRPDKAGVLAGLLTPGMRAVSIAISNPSAVSGFVTPGDWVDIVLAADLQKENEQNKGQGQIVRYAAETVLRDVKVLAIDQQITRGRDGGAIQGKTATVEVTPKQAEILTAAELIGNLHLVLRGAAKDGDADIQGFTPDTEASQALRSLTHPVKTSSATPAASVEINRAGHISREGVVR